jgi:hypothetical protein
MAAGRDSKPRFCRDKCRRTADARCSKVPRPETRTLYMWAYMSEGIGSAAPYYPNDPIKKMGRAGEHSAQVFGRPCDRRGHFDASPQAALASRRGEGGGEGSLASLHKRPISSCAAGLWIQPRPCKQSGSNLSSKATARQLANLPERASSRARACTRAKVSLKSRLSCVIRGSLARAGR